MVDIFGVTPIGPHGGKRPGAGRPRKGEVRPPKPERPRNVLNSGEPGYLIRRLARDAQGGCKDAATLLQGVRDGLISAHTAGIEMNYRQRPEPNGRGSENAARTRDWALHRLFNPHPAPKEKTPPEDSGA
jgi:hypothetical protein